VFLPRAATLLLLLLLMLLHGVMVWGVEKTTRIQ
jgi:hypothetical protein